MFLGDLEGVGTCDPLHLSSIQKPAQLGLIKIFFFYFKQLCWSVMNNFNLKDFIRIKLLLFFKEHIELGNLFYLKE